MKFYVMDDDRQVSLVTIEGKKVSVNHFVESFFYPFCKADEVPLSAVTAFFEDRCFDRNRPDKEELLGYLGLTEYNPWEIVKKTEGRMMHDRIWVDFVED